MSKSKHAGFGPRTIARKKALFALFQWFMTQEAPQAIHANLPSILSGNTDLSVEDWAHCDEIYYQELFFQCVQSCAALEAVFCEFMDRALARISLVERSVLLLATYELQNHNEIPYRVVINEAVNLAKDFGGNDGFKYVNGILDKVARKLRADEFAGK